MGNEDVVKNLFETLQRQVDEWFSSSPDTVSKLNMFFVNRLWKQAQALQKPKSHIDSFDYFKFSKEINVILSKANEVTYPYAECSGESLNHIFRSCESFSGEDADKAKQDLLALTDESEQLQTNFTIKSISNATDCKTTKLITICTNFRNPTRKTYFSAPCEVVLALNMQCGISLTLLHSGSLIKTKEDSGGEIAFPSVFNIIQYGVENSNKVSNAALTNFLRKSLPELTVTSLIAEYLSIVCNVEKFTEVTGVSVDIDKEFGPRCSVSGALTFGDKRTCSIRGCILHPDIAVKIGDLYYHPDVVKTCRKCGKTSHEWVPQEGGVSCGGCVNE